MLLLSISACSKYELIEQELPEEQVQNNAEFFEITDLWQISMRREMLLPFKVYVLQVNHKWWFYLRRLNFDGELHIGDEIAFKYYRNVPNEVSSIIDFRPHGGAMARESVLKPAAGDYLVASDPIEADVKNMFILNMCYSSPSIPVETVLIETTDGNFLYVKSSKLPETNSQDLAIGDHFVYNVYTIYPNEVLAIKKL